MANAHQIDRPSEKCWHHFGKIHHVQSENSSISMAVFNSYIRYIGHYQRVYPRKSHETTIFPWVSYGFPMVSHGFRWRNPTLTALPAPSDFSIASVWDSWSRPIRLGTCCRLLQAFWTTHLWPRHNHDVVRIDNIYIYSTYIYIYIYMPCSIQLIHNININK